MNEEISSDSESESLAPRRREEEEEEEELEETAQEKKLRLAKLYLEQLRQQEEEKAEARAFEEDQVAGRLKEDVLEQRGRLQKSVAKEVQAPAPADIRVLRGHQLSITCLVITPDDSAIFSAAKDCTIIKWSVETGRKLHVIPRAKKGAEGQPPGHSSHVLCMAISSDGKYLASGDRSKLILIWEAQSCRHLYTFTGHRDAVSGLAFRRGTHQLYSTSHDRSVKVWNVAENSYVETLFGHQDAVAALDALSRECCVTAGAGTGRCACGRSLRSPSLSSTATRAPLTASISSTRSTWCQVQTTAPWLCGAFPRSGPSSCSEMPMGCVGSRAWSSPSGCRQWQRFSTQTS